MQFICRPLLPFFSGFPFCDTTVTGASAIVVADGKHERFENLAEEFGDETLVAAGQSLYTRNCEGCHGATAVSGGVLPDLRHSAFTRDRDAWNLVVREGILKDSGMVSFAENLDAEEAEAIRAYVIRRAHEPVN